MNTRIKNLFLLHALIAGLGLILSDRLTAQTFTTLYSFTSGDYLHTNGSAILTNSDGAYPSAGLIISGNALYGTANRGGDAGYGTVFKVNTNGTGFTTLHTFTALNNNTNSDGALPDAGLIISGNTLYGTAYQGGISGNGTVFALNTDGTGFTNLYDFIDGDDGANPLAGLILSSNTLYGTARYGGNGGVGTIFRLSLGPVSVPQLTIIPSGAKVILTWPTNAAGFTLQCATNLVSSAVWTAVSPEPVVINGNNTVTNPISGPRKFYRLAQ